MRYYIADLHFFHANMNTRMDKRGFDSVEAMTEYMISRWNKKVRKNDEVVILGDLSIGKGVETNELLKRLNGKKYMIIGNHDRFLQDKEFDHSLLEWEKPYHELNDNNRKIVLSHYPVFCYNGQYRLNGEGEPKVYMLYGHVHNTYDEVLVNEFQNITREQKRMVYHSDEPRAIPCHMINCFCMFSDYTPLTLDEWIELDAKRRSEMPDLSEYKDDWMEDIDDPTFLETSDNIMKRNEEAYGELAK